MFPVNDQTFLFFTTIEKLVQIHLPSRLKRPKETVKCDVVERVMDHTLIQQQWAGLSQYIESENDVLDLLKVVVTKWVTMRGFSLAATWMEAFKKEEANTTRKKCSFRKELF